MPDSLVGRATVKDAFVLICLTVGAGVYSLHRGQDANWDLKNYHLYNAFAYIHDRLLVDIAPAQLQSYHNPLLDLPFFALVGALNDYPRIISFAMGLPAALALFFLWKSLLVAFPSHTRARGSYVVASLLFAVSGAAGIAQWGTTMNEWHVAALHMAAFFILVRSAARGPLTAGTLASAGVISGLATGLKLTAAASSLALVVGVLFLDRRLRATTVFVAATAVGFLLAAGPWMLTMCRDFGNPLYPYFNQVFRSPWLEPQNVLPRTFGPKTVGEAVLFPFQMLYKNNAASEPYLRDWHMPLVYVAGVAAAIKALLSSFFAPSSTETSSQPIERFVAAFIAVFYLVWLGVFAIYRYVIPFELLSGWALIIFLKRLLPAATLTGFLFIALLALWITKVNPGWGRTEFGPRYFDVEAPRLPDRSLVLLTSGQPMAYTIPFFRADAAFIGVDNQLVYWGGTALLGGAIRERIRESSGPIFAMDLAERENFAVLNSYGLAVDRASCTRIKSNFDLSGITLCEVRKSAAN